MPAPAEPQPEPAPKPPIKPNPNPEIPSDPAPAPIPAPARPQPNPQPVTDPDPDIQEWRPDNDPSILPGSIPLPNDALPLTIPSSNPTPQTAPITPTNAIVPASPFMGGPTPATPTTVVPQIPPGAKPIYQPNPGPGQIVPAGNPNPDPCKPIGGDLCQGQISDVVKSNSDKIQQLDLKTVGNTAAIAAITAALLATPVTIKKFIKCKGTEPVFETEIITVPAFLILATLKNFERLADIEAQVCLQCSELTAIATVPEWWQLRPEARRPQAILVFREVRADNTLGNDHYAITIPHFSQSTPPAIAPLTTYKKGNFEGILTLNDNSKLIVNCVDADECTRVIGRLSAFIDGNQLTNSSTKIGQRSGLPFKEITVKAFRLDYYPNGVKTMRPAYLKSYS
jgi:hypothetical protein